MSKNRWPTQDEINDIVANPLRWFDELEWSHRRTPIMWDDGTFSAPPEDELNHALDTYETSYFESCGDPVTLIIEDMGFWSRWMVITMEEHGDVKIPTLVVSRGNRIESMEDAKASLRSWFKKGKPVHRWSKHYAQERTYEYKDWVPKSRTEDE